MLNSAKNIKLTILLVTIVLFNYFQFGSSKIIAKNITKDEVTNNISTVAQNYYEFIKDRVIEGRKQLNILLRRKEDMDVAAYIISASKNDICDWKTKPMAFIKGELCGSHYKVLGIDRNDEVIDKAYIKKKYRQLSLSLHPDKNPSKKAEKAFYIVQDAHNCISDNKCKEEFDEKLSGQEKLISVSRDSINTTISNLFKKTLFIAHKVVEMGMFLWNLVDKWKISVYSRQYSIGRPLLLLLLFWKGQLPLKIYAVCFLFTREIEFRKFFRELF